MLRSGDRNQKEWRYKSGRKKEQIPIIVVAKIGFKTNFENVKSSFIFFLRAVIAIVKATA